jgi:two-component system LytT family sensor kinase
MFPRTAKIAAAVTGITTVLALLTVAQRTAWAAYEGRPFPTGAQVVARLVDWYTCLIFLPLFWWLVRRLLATRASWPRTITVLLFASIIISAAKYAIYLPLQQWLSGNRTTTLAGVLSSNVIIEMMIFWAAIALMYGFEYYRQFKERERLQLELERRISEMQLEALRAQLHPHFLFNTLNAIATVLHRDPARADKAIINLAELLRAVMEQRDREEIPLEAELDLAKRYLDIMSLRSGESVTVSWSIAPEAREAAVPYFILQPLLENALEHGFAHQPDNGHLGVSACVRNDVLQLVVEDNGAGLGANPSGNGVGLSTTSQRLSELYGSAGRLALENGINGGSRVIVEIPLKHASVAA